MASDEDIAAQLLNLFLSNPSKYADGIQMFTAAKKLQHPMSCIARVTRSLPGTFAVIKKKTMTGRTQQFVVCLSPLFNAQVPPKPEQGAGASDAGSDLHCAVCNQSFCSDYHYQQHLRTSRHRAAVLMQQLRTSGSVHANRAGLQVSEFEEVTDLQVHTTRLLSLVVENVGSQPHTLQGVHQVRTLPEVEMPDGTDGYRILPRQRLELQFPVTPRQYGMLCTLIVLSFGDVAIARELRVGCCPAGLEDVDIGPTTPYSRSRGRRLPPQPSTNYEPGERPPKAKVPWLRPPRQHTVPRRLRQLVAEGRLEEVQSELDAYMGKTDISSHIAKMHLLLWLEELQQELDVRAYDMEGALLEPPGAAFFGRARGAGGGLALDVPGLAESRPSVMKGDALFVRPAGAAEGAREWQGYVHAVRLEQVLLKFSRIFHTSVHVCGRRYDVRFAIKRTPFVFMHQGLDDALTGAVGGARSELLMPPPAPQPAAGNGIKMRPSFWINKQLNEEQRAAVQCVVEGSSWPLPFIIWGPPGTGKTSTMVEAAAQVLRLQAESKLLLVAPSNTAADMLAGRLLAAGHPPSQLLRVCAYGRPKADLAPGLEDVVLWDAQQEAFGLPTLEQALRVRVLVLTPIMAAKMHALGVGAGHFSHIMMDESGQAEEPLALSALSGLVGQHCSLTLAGDPKQLGPIIHSRLATHAGLSVSLLERLTRRLPYAAVRGLQQQQDGGGSSVLPGAAAQPCAFIVKLVKNYRSHPDLLRLPSRLFYGGELRPCAHRDDTHNLLHWEGLPNKKVPLIFHSLVGKEEREANSPSWFNQLEAKVVVSYVKDLVDLRRSRVSPDQIGIITPYRKQVQKLQQLLRSPKLGLEGVKVGSVEQFQGSERRVIIISTVRSTAEFLEHDVKHKLGFVANPKRFNVATTRAKALLIVVGNPAVLRCDPRWLELLRFAQDHGCVKGGAMPDLSESAADAAAAAFGAAAQAPNGAGASNGGGGNSGSGLGMVVGLLEGLMASLGLRDAADERDGAHDGGTSWQVDEEGGGMVRLT